MAEVDIQLKDDQQRFYTGDRVTGTALVTLPEDVPTTGIVLAFLCMGEVKWTDSSHPSPNNRSNSVAYDQHIYHEEVLHDTNAEFCLVPEVDRKQLSIPFEFTIPKDLPSSMESKHGFVRYVIRLTVNPNRANESKFLKDLTVFSPIEHNLMVTVGGTAEKLVLLHGGKISMYASLTRKGFAPGDTITVQLAVDNRTSARVIPRAAIHKVEIYMSGSRHKTIEATVSDEPIVGAEIGAHLKLNEMLLLRVPKQLALSIKSPVVTVKYFVHVTLTIPHSFDLHMNLPIVITSAKTLERLRQEHGAVALASHERPPSMNPPPSPLSQRRDSSHL